MTIAKDWSGAAAWRGGYERERDAYGDLRARVNTVNGMVGVVFCGAAEIRVLSHWCQVPARRAMRGLLVP
jgi:hypothetical protein